MKKYAVTQLNGLFEFDDPENESDVDYLKETGLLQTPIFKTKADLWKYCEENGIECTKLERDVIKERLFEYEKPKTDLDRLKELFNDMGVKNKEVQEPNDDKFTYLNFQDNEGNYGLFTFTSDGKLFNK